MNSRKAASPVHQLLDELRAASIVKAFSSIARPIMRKWMGVNSCVASTKTTIAAMESLGLQARPLPVASAFQVPTRRYAYLSGYPAEERERIREKAATYIDLDVENGWNGHLIAVVEERWLLDSSIDQAAS